VYINPSIRHSAAVLQYKQDKELADAHTDSLTEMMDQFEELQRKIAKAELDLKSYRTATESAQRNMMRSLRHLNSIEKRFPHLF
jgi:chromosome segregation ATPase